MGGLVPQATHVLVESGSDARLKAGPDEFQRASAPQLLTYATIGLDGGIFGFFVGCFGNFSALCDRIKTPLTAFVVFTFAGAWTPHSSGTRRPMIHCYRAGTGHIHMTAYRITQRGARIIVGTEQEAILVCRSLEVAHQAVADAELLATLPAKLIFARRVVREESQKS